MIYNVGYLILITAMLITAFGMTMGFWGGYTRNAKLAASSSNAIYAAAALVGAAAVILWYGLLTDQFQLSYVWNHSERALSFFYKFAALWGGQAGSLLFWTLILAIYSVIVAIGTREQHQRLMPYVNAVLHGTMLFFLILLVFATNPFEQVGFVPEDGRGLNPLLQNYWMVIHPVMLYLGWVGMTVPFAFAVAALVTGQLGNDWVHTIRRWTLVPWMFLTAGVLMGSQWAYVELGWGGYWAWDAVENASFLPWLTATAFLHSIMIQERRGMLKVWNMVLIGTTFGLTVFGTFLTRSGIIESVHAFALSNIGPLFLSFIVLSFLGYLGLLFYRWDDLRSVNQLDSMVSRESAFLFNNLVLFGIMAVTLFGTLYPLISDFLGNFLPIAKMSFAAPWFNKVTGPLFLLLIALMGSAPLLSWRRSSTETLRQNFTFPILFGLGVAAMAFALGVHKPFSALSFGVAGFVVGGLLQEFYRGGKARRQNKSESWPAAIWQLFRRNQRRYGGYTVHFGVILIMVAIIGANAYQVEAQANLKTGETLTVQDWELTYAGLEQVPASTFDKIEATLQVTHNGKAAGEITPAMNFYRTVAGQDQPTNEISIRMGLSEDLYVVLAGWEGTGESASFKVYVNPLMSWMWIGGVIMILGTLLAIWPHQKESERVAVSAPAPRGAQPA